MISLAVAVLVVGAVLFLWRDAKPLLQRKLALSEERLRIDERRVEIERQATLKPVLKDEDPMPQDFVEWAMQESSEWAREDKLARMRELYARLHDWKKVRTALMAEDEAAYKSTFQ